MSKPMTRLVVALAALVMVASACGSTYSTEDGLEAIRVPDNVGTIQEAVDAAEEGDVILISEGTYNEAVDVTTPNITIRGVDRNNVILDGEFELENGIRILDTDGVVVENMTARNYTGNGFFWTGSDYYRGSYLTAYRNGDYGIYAFDAYHGQFDNSLGWGSPDAGVYIGECYPCDAVVTDFDSQYNGLGYPGTNSGGELYVINSTFSNNRAGIVPNSGAYELCYPERESTVVGNIVNDNNYLDGPGISVSLLAQGNGILPAGGVRNLITKNLVYNHDITGIGFIPYPEADAADVAPPKEEWDTPCEETRDNELPGIPEDECFEQETINELLGDGCIIVWNPFENTVTDNVVENSGVADLAVGTIDLNQTGETTDTLDNCFSGNTFATSQPANLETLAPCDGEGSGSWDDNPLDLIAVFGNPAPEPPKDSYQSTPEPPEQENMADAKTKAHEPFEGPMEVDVDAIALPEKPAT
ncbi:MAG: right-handed parallel beta-helix repeat-containing protein [Microthrixaceae bacterium]